MDELDRTYQYQKDLKGMELDANRTLYAQQLQQESHASQAALVEQTNPLKILMDIEFKLRGERMIGYGESVKIVKFGEPIMNDMGISRMIFLLSSIVNQNTIFAHLQDEEINKLIIKISDDIVDDLTLNWNDYGIKDKMLLDYIVDALVIPSFMALKRAWRQNEKNWLNKTVVESITTSPRLPQKKESFMSRFKT